MKKSQKIILFIIITVLIVGVYFLLIPKGKQPLTTSEPAGEIKTEAQVVAVSSVYTNKEYGFRFVYPEGWHIGDSNPGRGTLQLFNYQESLENGSVFSEGMNKIEAVIVASNPYEPSSDYPEVMHETTEIDVAGQKASRVEIELIGGEKMLGYLISLANTDGKFVAITIYGDYSNFYMLENLINSLEWVD